jgi:hypothetical protein
VQHASEHGHAQPKYNFTTPEGLTEDVYDHASEAEYADDPNAIDVTSVLEDILELLKTEHAS